MSDTLEKLDKLIDVRVTSAFAISYFHNQPDAVVVVKPDTGLIYAASDEFCTLFDYHISELIDQPIEMLIPDRFRENHTKYREKYAINPRVRAMGEGSGLEKREGVIEFYGKKRPKFNGTSIEFKAIIKFGKMIVPGVGTLTIASVRVIDND